MGMGMVSHALKSMATHVKEVEGGLPRKAQMAMSLSLTLIRELLSGLSMVPFLIQSQRLYSSLLPLTRPGSPRLHKDIRYGPACRNLLDVYVPSSIPSEADGGNLPVVVFVHGGVWASGSKEMFSPIGASLAGNGILTIILQYTLFPTVLAAEQVKEVSLALSWVLKNAPHYGGDPDKVFLMGHSAGAHLGAMVVWERLCSEDNMNAKQQPFGFIGIAGVYDIVEHLEHEKRRGVDVLSCMSSAMGGIQGFRRLSPALLFKSLGEKEAKNSSSSGGSGGNSRRLREALPDCLIIASSNDTTVPPSTSVALHEALLQIGCNSDLVLLQSFGHADFVFWSPEKNRAEHGLFLEKVVEMVTKI